MTDLFDESSLSPVHEHNRRAWDQRVEQRARFTEPADDASVRDWCASLMQPGPLAQQIRGSKVLCLAAGGGKHSILFAAAGAEVTVVDLSPAMLALDRAVAAERGLQLQTVEASMDDLRIFASGQFDLVVQPVSTCYVPEIGKVYQEVARVTRAGGLYLSQHKQPVSLQAAVLAGATGYEITEPYYREGPLPDVGGSPHREAGTLEFLHRWEQLIGLLCRAGFVLEDLIEPQLGRTDARRGTFAHRSFYIPPYVRLIARRKGTAPAGLLV